MKNLLFGVVASILATTASVAGAAEKPADFPRKPIEVVVVYPAGGGMDVTARTFAAAAERVLGHRFQVVNRVGGGGLVGHTYLAKEAKPDGYTVGVLAMGNLITDILVKGGEFAADDLDPIGFINFDPVVIMSRGEPLEELVEKAKGAPKSIRAGVTPKSATSMIVEVIEKQAGVEFERVPYQGGKPRIAALLSNTIDMNPGYFVEGEQYIKAGELKAIAVASSTPLSQSPETPTLTSLGYDIPEDTWGAARFIALPKGVPDEVRNYLAEAFLEVLKDPETQAAYEKQGLKVQVRTAEETARSYRTAFDTIKAFLDETQLQK